MTIAHIFTGGDPVSAERWAGLPAPDLVLAADSGADLAMAAGLTVDVLVGDLDSVSKKTLDAIFDEGTTIEAHPSDKAATDLELALDAARRRGADEIVVIGGGGGRLDHLLGNAAVITDRNRRGGADPLGAGTGDGLRGARRPRPGNDPRCGRRRLQRDPDRRRRRRGDARRIEMDTA